MKLQIKLIKSLATGEIICVNAGHEYPAIKRKGGKYELLLSDNCPPLAAMEDTEYPEMTVKLEAGDSLFLYTDGVPEAKSADGTRYGTDKMTEVLSETDGGLNMLLTTLKEDIDRFDDITMLGINYYGSADHA